MAQESHALTARSLIADTLDLIHRLPRTWAVVLAGDCEPWVARKVAVLSRSLLADTVGVVDRAVARALAGHAPSTVLGIARAKWSRPTRRPTPPNEHGSGTSAT